MYAIRSYYESRMDTAVVEFDTLADPVGPAAENHDFLGVGFLGLVLHLVGGVVIRGVGFEFRRAGVDQLVDRRDTVTLPEASDIVFSGAGQKGELRVGESLLFADT